MGKNLKIAFFTEGNYHGKLQRSASGRTDVNWIVSLDATHHNIYEPLSEKFDIGIIIIPKKFNGDWQKLYDLKRNCEILSVMQEADQIAFQRMTVPNQIEYINFLSEVDLILAHNEIDKKYFAGLIPNKKVEILPTLMLEDNIRPDVFVKEGRYGVMSGGTWSDWYCGADSFMIAQEFEEPIFAPSMGRKQPEEDLIQDIRYLPYSDWKTWMFNLSKCKYAVHLMRTAAAGSFSINCAVLKIPSIGWDQIDAQRICYPELSFPVGDMVEARKAAKHLKNNELFYDHVAEYAFKAYKDNFHEDRFLERFCGYFQ